MAAGKTKTAEQKERERDKRLQDKYRWSLERRNRLSESQGGKCAICGRPENPEHPLNLDHKHFKISISGKKGAYVAVAHVEGVTAIGVGMTKKAATEACKNEALPHSVRGLLCPGRRGCNRRLGWVDDIAWLEAAIRYLKNPPAQTIDKTPKV